MAEKPDLTPNQAKAFSDTLFDKIIAGAEAVRDLDEKITRMYRKIDQTRNAKSGTACTNAFITILADEDGPAQLRLIYRKGDSSELYQSHSLFTHRCAQSSLGASIRPTRNVG